MPKALNEFDSFTDFKELQRLKALSPMYITESGISIDVRDVQYAKGTSRICFRDEGSFIDLRDEHL